MKRKITIIIAVILALLLLTPVPIRYDDGGSVQYKAVLYSVYDIHRINPDMDTEDMYIEGIIIKVLGMKVYDSTQYVIECH